MKRVLNGRLLPMSDEMLSQSSFDIFVVDDEPVVADSLAMILSKKGYFVLTMYDARSAMEAARKSMPKLVITDVFMPGMTGIELALALQNSTPECKVLLFSGRASTVDLQETVRGHGFAFLSKPVHPTDMLRYVARYVVSVREVRHSLAS